MLSTSVALATYNGQRYLPAQLDSLAHQTAMPSELIVADDGSSDGTMEIVRAFAATAPFPVRIIYNQTRLGYRANFMQAAAACTCELIAFCDQDDDWNPDKLNLMQQAFADPKVLFAYHNDLLIDEGGTIIGTLFGKRGKNFDPLTSRPWKIIPGHTQIIRRSLLRFTSLHSKSIDPYCAGELMPHDIWYPFWASVLGNIVYIPERLALYRQHSSNTTGWPHIGWVGFVRDNISNAALYVGAESIGARNRLELLHGCRAILAPHEIAPIEAAIAYYEALCIQSDQRLTIYNGGSLGQRARALLALLKRGAYTGKVSQTFGFPALLLDSTIGVFLAQCGR